MNFENAIPRLARSAKKITLVDSEPVLIFEFASYLFSSIKYMVFHVL